MKIGIDARLWNETGVGRYIQNLVLNLQEIDKENEYVLFVKKGIELRVKSEKFKIIEVDINWHSLREQTSFAQVLNKEKLDLMHFPYFSLPILYKKPFVVTIHDLIFHNFSSGKASTLPLPLFAMKREGFKVVFRHAVTRSKELIVPLNCIKEEVTNQFGISGEKIAVTNEGFDSRLSNTLSPSDRIKTETKKGKYFLYVGNAYPHKNVEFLLNGFSLFQKKYPEYRLVLIIKQDVFLKKLQRSGPGTSLSYLSDVSDSDLGYLYRHAEAFVSSSLMEGFGLPPLEAMALGTPNVLSDIPSFKEVCGDTACYFNPKDTKSLYTQLEKLVNLTGKERESITQKAKLRVEMFSWKEMAEQTRKVYERSISV